MILARLGDWYYAEIAGHRLVWAPRGIDAPDDNGCAGDPDRPPGELWGFTPDNLRVLLERARDGADIDEIMLNVELLGVGEREP